MYDFVYFKYYRLSLFFNDFNPVSFLIKPRVYAITFLAGLETANILAILTYLDFKINIADHFWYPLIWSFFIVLNAIRFFDGRRYEIIDKQFKVCKPKHNVLGTILVIVYTIISVFTLPL